MASTTSRSSIGSAICCGVRSAGSCASWPSFILRESLDYRNAIKRKVHAYHVFIQAGVVCQGLLQYLSVVFPALVWNCFGSWLRTIRPGIPPSELVVANALRQSLPEFLLNSAESNSLAKFIVERQDPSTFEMFRLAS